MKLFHVLAVDHLGLLMRDLLVLLMRLLSLLECVISKAACRFFANATTDRMIAQSFILFYFFYLNSLVALFSFLLLKFWRNTILYIVESGAHFALV